jgi:UDP-GlcNAc:undecaprenyl-phosphate GlcNAc-1-phosphate transferase
VNATPLLAAVLGFGFSFGLIRILTPQAGRLGLIDRPSAKRKRHTEMTPTIGGLAIVAALALSALLGGFAGVAHPAFWAGLFAIAFTGALDDKFGLSPYVKFAVQIAAALAMIYWGGLVLHDLGRLVSEETLYLGRYAVPLTVFAIIGVINAINLCDGADGLAGGLVFISAFWIAAMSAVAGNPGTLALSLALLGCIAAFLTFNLRSPWRERAAIFLGDAGSLSLGFILACLCIEAAREGTQSFAPVTAIWLLAIPLSDTLTCMGRRLLHGQSPFRADRTHLHHILIDLGLPAGAAVALIHLIAFILAGAGVAGWVLHVPEHVMFYTAMAIFALYIALAQYGLWRVKRNSQLPA